MKRIQPGFAACVILSLAVGVSVGSAVMALVESVSRGPLPFGNAERLHHVIVTGPGHEDRLGPSTTVSGEVVEAISALGGVVEAVATYQQMPLESGRGGPAMLTSANFMRVLGAQFVLGRGFDSTDGPAVVLSQKYWVAQYARDSAVVGRSIQIDGRARTVVGVMAGVTSFPSGVNVWVSDEGAQARPSVPPSNYRTLVLARTGVPAVTARAAIATVGTRAVNARRRAPSPDRIDAQPFRAYLAWQLRGTVFFFSLIATFVGFLSAVNVAGLVLARGIRRRGELGVRAALGASVPRLVRHIVAESLALSAIGGLLGALATPAVLGLLRTTFANLLPPWFEVSVGIGTIAGSIALAMAIGVVFSIGPSLDLARPALAGFLRQTANTTSGSRSAARVRASVVSVQVALATGVLVCLGAVMGRWLFVSTPALGFEYERVLSGYVSQSSNGVDGVQSGLSLASRIRELPGVEAAAIVATAGRTEIADVSVFGDDDQVHRATLSDGRLAWMRVSDGFFETAGLRLIDGRLPTSSEVRSGAPVGVVGRSLARRLRGNATIGARMRLDHMPDAPSVFVVGIVDDIRRDPYADAAPLTLVTPFVDGWLPDRLSPFVELWVRSRGDAAQLHASLAATAHAGGVADVVDLQPAAARVARATESFRALARLAISLFAVAIALAAMGIFGLIAYSTSVRSREIAIREALGSTRMRVASLVVRDSLAQMAIGVVAGSAAGAATAVLIGNSVGAVLLPSVGASIVAVAIIALTVLLSSLGPLHVLWRRELSGVLRD